MGVAFPLLVFFLGLAAGREPAPVSKFTELDGIKIHYLDSGGGGKERGAGGAVLVFVHGWCGDAGVWQFQFPGLASMARLLLVDLPGHGQSDKPETKYTMDLFARAVAAVMRDAGVEKAILVGHSNGVPVIRQFYRLFPRETQALVLVEGSLRPVFADPAQAEPFLARMRADGYREFVAGIVDSMLPRGVSDEERAYLRSKMLATPQHVMVGAMEATLDPAIWKEDPIDVPLLAVMARSPFWTEEYKAFVRKLAPKVDYVVLDDVSHYLMMDAPDRFRELLEDFLKKNHFLAPASEKER